MERGRVPVVPLFGGVLPRHCRDGQALGAFLLSVSQSSPFLVGLCAGMHACKLANTTRPWTLTCILSCSCGSRCACTHTCLTACSWSTAQMRLHDHTNADTHRAAMLHKCWHACTHICTHTFEYIHTHICRIDRRAKSMHPRCIS